MNIVLLLSGGVGSRISSDVPKQYISVNGRMMITRCIEALLSCREVDALFIAAEPSWQSAIENEAARYAGRDFSERFKGFSEPGSTRQLSIYNGLKRICALSATDDTVILHDAARPLVTARTLSECIAACKEHDGAMPALPMKDTVYISDDGKGISALLDRKKVIAGQAPEAFRLGRYLAANEALMPDRILSINGASEPAVLAGMDIAVIPGDEGNYKITTDKDLDRYMRHLREAENIH